jgi:hypothetical protein
MVKEEKQENMGVLLNFKYSVSPIRYGDLHHIWNYTKKIFHRKEVYEDFWENVNICWLVWQKKIEYIIRN